MRSPSTGGASPRLRATPTRSSSSPSCITQDRVPRKTKSPHSPMRRLPHAMATKKTSTTVTKSRTRLRPNKSARLPRWPMPGKSANRRQEVLSRQFQRRLPRRLSLRRSRPAVRRAERWVARGSRRHIVWHRCTAISTAWRSGSTRMRSRRRKRTIFGCRRTPMALRAANRARWPSSCSVRAEVPRQPLRKPCAPSPG